MRSSLLPVTSLSSPANFPAILRILQRVASGTASLQVCKKAHACAIIFGFDRYRLISSSPISACSLFGLSAPSHFRFFGLSSPNIFFWNSLLAAFSNNACYHQVLTAFRYVWSVSGEPPDGYTLAIVAKALTELLDSINGRAIHSFVKRLGLCSDTVLANTLMLFYFKCRHPDDAQLLFDEIPLRTVSSWNALISEHVRSGTDKEWGLLREMQSEGIKPNGFTVSVLLPLCSGGGSTGVILGRQIHCYIVRHGLRFGSELHVACCLINLYSKSVDAKTAWRVFECEPTRNVFVWTAMIAGYVESGEFDDALRLLSSMIHADGIMPNEVTVVTVLPAVGSLAALDIGKQIHGFSFRRCMNAETSVNNALIVMYSKCGSVVTARRVFDDKSWRKDAISWSSVISCYGIHGMGGEALSLFEKMRSSGMEVNNINGVGVLIACSRAGLVREGLETFVSLVKCHGVTPSAEMCACMVDILGRAGQLEQALVFINSTPWKRKSAVWGALFGAAVSHRNQEIQHLAGKFILQTEPENPSHYVSLSNFHASFGRWDVVDEVRGKMMAKGLRKNPGLSWIDIDGKVHSFHVADRSHLSSSVIYEVLGSLSQEIKETPKSNNII